MLLYFLVRFWVAVQHSVMRAESGLVGIESGWEGLLYTITYPIETTIKLVYYKSWEWEYYTQIIYLLLGLDDYLFQILLPYNEVVINLQ